MTVEVIRQTFASAVVRCPVWCDNEPELRDDPADQNYARSRRDGRQACVRSLRITVGTIVGLVASGRTIPDILAAYPYLEEDDIREALFYAAWRVEETEVPLGK